MGKDKDFVEEFTPMFRQSGGLILFSVSEENCSDQSDSLVVCEGDDRDRNMVQTIVVTDQSQAFYV